jgi:predicted DNA-binding transcriptional regulator YafY
MSNRLVKALRILDLLKHRRSVPREALERETDATERTVYRILRSMSEADIPVYYDRDTQGYRLNFQPSPMSLELSLQELALAVFALDLLSEVVGSGYQEVLAEARDRLVRCHPYDLDDTFLGHELAPAVDGLGSIDAALNSALVSAAMEAHRSVEVDVDGDDGVPRRVVIAEPSLVYKSPDWLIVDKAGSESFAMSSVGAVRITSKVPAWSKMSRVTAVGQ